MANLLRTLAQLSRRAKLGLLTAGSVAAGVAAVATSGRVGSEPTQSPPAAVALGAPAADGLQGADLREGPTPIELELDPAALDWPDEHEVEISGSTAIDATDPKVAITVVSPSGKSHRLEPAAISGDGSFRASFELNEADRLELGVFTVTVTSPGGFGTASGSFTVGRFEEVKARTWVEPADRLTQRGFDLVANLRTCLGNMPVSPAREDLKARLSALEGALKERMSATPSLTSLYAGVMAELEELPDEAAGLEELIEPLSDKLDAWGKEADRLEHRVRHDGRRCDGAVSCDRADLIAQDLDALSELLTLLRRPVELIGGYRNSAELQKALRSQTMPDLAFLTQKLDYARTTLDAAASGLASLQGQIEETRALAQRELFQPYCQKFEGPVSLQMRARAWSKGGEDWWRFETALEGQLTLRYPSAPGGRSVALTGELTGCATKFQSWDNAMRVGWPKLMAGALLFRTVNEPFQGTCPRYELPVKGELRGEELVIMLESAATEDYGEPSASVKYVVISPLAGGLPATTSFELPYKSAHFIWNRALEGKALTLPIRRVGNQLVVQTELRASRGGERVMGEYEGTLKACNPGCTGGGGGSSPEL